MEDFHTISDDVSSGQLRYTKHPSSCICLCLHKASISFRGGLPPPPGDVATAGASSFQNCETSEKFCAACCSPLPYCSACLAHICLAVAFLIRESSFPPGVQGLWAVLQVWSTLPRPISNAILHVWMSLTPSLHAGILHSTPTHCSLYSLRYPPLHML